MRHLFPVVALAAVAACQSGPISGTPDSNVRGLDVGMSLAEVGTIIGASQEEVILPDGTLCVSYLYDEVIAPKFVHAVFADEALVSASDGHAVTCSGI